MSAPADTRPTPGQKLRFAVWGIRHFDILVLMAYPTLGAAIAIRQPGLLPIVRFALFSVLNFFFIAQVFIFNDWSDARLNPDEPSRRSRHALKHPALSNVELLSVAAVFAVVSLAGFFFLSPPLFVAGLAITVITVLYSHPAINLKGRPVISTVIHFLGAGLYFLGGFVAFSHLTGQALALTLFFALVLAAGHFANEIQDFNQDRDAGIRTNAIAFGQRRVFRAGLFLFLGSSAILLLTGLATDSRFYAGCGALLLAAWLGAAWRWRGFQNGDPIRPFRRFYRGLYALLSGAILVQRALVWWW